MSKLLYAMYDLANSAYTMVIVTFVTSAYFAKEFVSLNMIKIHFNSKFNKLRTLIQRH